jgi:hypothetical protein
MLHYLQFPNSPEIYQMTQSELFGMLPSERAKWLTSVSPTSTWEEGDNVFCLHCDGVFKAEDVACDPEGDPTCPVCRASTPLDFHYIPWWRSDLVKEGDGELDWEWRGTPIVAIEGKPMNLPAEKNQ